MKLFKHLEHAQEIELDCKWAEAMAGRVHWSQVQEIVAQAKGVRIVRVAGLVMDGYKAPERLTLYSPYIAFTDTCGFTGAKSTRDVALDWAVALDKLRLESSAPMLYRDSWVSTSQSKFEPRNSQLALDWVEKLDVDLATRINRSASSIDVLVLRVRSFEVLKLGDLQDFFAELWSVREVIFQGTFELALMHIVDVAALTRHQSIVRFAGFTLGGYLNGGQRDCESGAAE